MTDPMHAYRIDGATQAIVELGPADPARFEEWLALVEAGQSTGDYVAFGLYRDERDFIELGPVGAGRFLLHSDRLVRGPGLLGALFGKGHLGRELASRADALACAHDYIELTREAFEHKYG